MWWVEEEVKGKRKRNGVLNFEHIVQIMEMSYHDRKIRRCQATRRGKRGFVAVVDGGWLWMK